MRLTRSRQRSSGHSARGTDAGTCGVEQALVSRYFPELRALIAGLPAGPLRQAALASGCSRAAADEPAGHRSPGLRGCRAADRGDHRRPSHHLRAYGTPPGPLDRRAAVVLGWLTVLFAAVTAGIAA